MLDERLVTTELGTLSVATGGSGRDLVLLHSLLSNRDVFYRVLPALMENHRVHLVDLPGFGQTTLVEPTMDTYGRLVGAMLQADGLPADTIVLGNGLGGFVAVATAVHHGDRFGNLIVAGAGLVTPENGRVAFPAMSARAGEAGMAGVVDQAVRRIFPEAYLEAHPDELAERRAVLLETPVAAFQAACAALISFDYTDVAASISNRTLMIVGSDDEATPPGLGQDLAAVVPGCTYIELPGIAHGPQLQDPEGFLSAIRPFLAA